MTAATVRPGAASRLRAARLSGGMSQRTAVHALRACSSAALPSEETLIRSWKKWEAGTHRPDAFYRPLIARALGTAADVLFPAPAAATRVAAATPAGARAGLEARRAEVAAELAYLDALLSVHVATPVAT